MFGLCLAILSYHLEFHQKGSVYILKELSYTFYFIVEALFYCFLEFGDQPTYCHLEFCIRESRELFCT